MRDKSISLLKELTEAHSVPGHEDEVRAVFADELQDKGEMNTDKLGSIFCEHGSRGPKVLLAGHMDEIGFLVQNITADGFVQFVAVGGWWTHTLLSQRVQILNSHGEKVIGVVSSKPPHFLPEAQRKAVMAIEALFIDIGASSRQEAMDAFGIRLGDPIAPMSDFVEMNKKGYFMAKAFDNRVGMACAIQAYQMVIEEGHPNRLIAAGSVQEEVGLRGAKTLANAVRPDVAIILEGPPADDTPGFSRVDAQGKLGGGVQIRLFDPTAIGNPRLAKFVTDTAEKAGIKHQVTVRRSGGTDAGSMHISNEGVPSIVLGTPARYIHSHNAIIDINDYMEMVKLSVALAKRLDEDAVASLTQYL